MFYSEIKFIKRKEYNGITYSWFVAHKNNRVSSSRNFINYDESGKTCIKEYPVERLPKMIQKFIADHSEKEIEEFIGFDNEGFKTFIYK